MGEVMTTTFIGKVLDLLFNASKRQIDYVRNYTEIVEKLRNEAQKLKDMRGRIQQQIDVAQDKGDGLLAGVEHWMDKAHTEISMAEDFLEEEANVNKTWFNFNSRLCVNLGTLYQYSKMATYKTRVLVQHQEDGKTYESGVSIPTPSPGFLDLYQRKNLDDINTQKLTLEKVITAISNKSTQIVGIYGLGGVGKTTLAKEVAVKMKTLFADIVFIKVSQIVDAKMIEEKVKDAAKKIINEKNVLIILDDVWEKILLPDVGIPCGSDHMNCKILFTSRSKNVCEAMAERNNIICLNILPMEEAWILFKRVVDDPELETNVKLKVIAVEVTKECGGLVSIIEAVGTALKNKNINFWKAALDRLQNHAPGDIDPEIKKAYAHLKLSYDYLESEEAKSCFLLCSLFKEDETIRLKTLAEYGVGLGIFHNLHSINDAKNRVQIAVDTLTSSFLLLREEWQNRVRMHNVVRDMALFITSTGKESFLVKAGEKLSVWQLRNNTSETYTKISVMDCRIHINHEFHFPHLDTLILQKTWIAQDPDEFFEGMRELKILDMPYCTMSSSSLPQSLKLLTKLRMLNLSENTYFQDISVLGELKDLEILKLRSTSIKRVPQEIGQLTNLKLLDVHGCKHLSHVAPGVISNLILLEKLYIGFFLNQEGNYNCLVELSNLKSLKTLHLFVLHYDLIPEDPYFKSLTKFSIQIGEKNSILVGRNRSRRLQMAGSNIPLRMLIKELIQVSDSLALWLIKDLDNIVPNVYKESFYHLQSIILRDCQNISCLVKTRNQKTIQNLFTANKDIGQRKKEKFFSQVKEIYLVDLPRLERLWDCPHEYISFYNLQKMEVYGCSSLLTLFPESIAQELANLRDIFILRCDNLTDVISARDDMAVVDANIVFPLLTNISLGYLPKLKTFYSGHSNISYPSLKSITVENCPSMERWGYGVHEMPQISFLHQGSPCTINDIIAVHHADAENKDMKFGTPL